MKNNNNKIKKKGFTLIELMIVVAILGIVVLGLTSVFKTFLNSWWLARTKLTTQEDAREAAYWIVKDFKGARRTTLGSIVMNSGFERGSGTDNAYYWKELGDAGVSEGASRISSSQVSDTATVRTGDYSIEITDVDDGFPYEIESESFGVTSSTDYILSGWFRIEGSTVTEFSVKDSGGNSDLNVSATIPASEGEWGPFWATGTLTQDSYTIFVEYYSETNTNTIYIDDISLTPLSWVMVDNAGSIVPECSTYYYTTQTGAGGETEGPLHALVVEERTTSAGDIINRIVRKELTTNWSVSNYDTGVYSGNWRVLGFNTLAENVSYMAFTMGGPSKESPLQISLKFTGTPTGGTQQEFEVRTQVYPLTE
ncbi:MAG: prepilin-type N-terminal cleavage/methylation domain-containing protein [Elusimicrobia bacterium]|jgi:prepilin-type N-terminal cleavage/methylation domain-containing protein|nr:prepilin-type N-terminal cleavage/methylation domain-containing protein [Elusimicrobiota bacterium]